MLKNTMGFTEATGQEFVHVLAYIRANKGFSKEEAGAALCQLSWVKSGRDLACLDFFFTSAPAVLLDFLWLYSGFV